MCLRRRPSPGQNEVGPVHGSANHLTWSLDWFEARGAISFTTHLPFAFPQRFSSIVSRPFFGGRLQVLPVWVTSTALTPLPPRSPAEDQTTRPLVGFKKDRWIISTTVRICNLVLGAGPVGYYCRYLFMYSTALLAARHKQVLEGRPVGGLAGRK